MRSRSIHKYVAHRGGLQKLRPDPTLFERIGGRETIERIVDGLYDGIENDPTIRPMFISKLEGEWVKQKDFFQEWFGSTPEYTQHHVYSSLQHRHIHITPASAKRWLGHLNSALRAAVSSKDLVKEVMAVARPMAMAFVNEETDPGRPNHLRCHRVAAFRPLKQMAGGDQASDLKKALDADPHLLDDELEMAEIVMEAASCGKRAALSTLLDAGVDPNIPAPYKEGCIIQSLLLAPLCAALAKGRHEAADMREARGSIDDIYTACFLGDNGTVEKLLDEAPASDVLEVTPVHHAFYGGHMDTVRLLFNRGATPGKNDTPLIRHAANNADVPLTQLLLEHGADATRVGPGSWVLSPDVVNLLDPRGAGVNYPHGEWVWRSCTGNNSQRDNPDLVSAMLDRGADIHTRLRGAMPLHYTAKA